MAWFGKKENQISDRYVDELIGWLDDEIIIVRDCKLLYKNAAATKEADSDETACRQEFASRFKEICKFCPLATEHDDEKPVAFETEDIMDNIFSVKAKTVLWVDDKPATIITLTDITKQRKSEEHLYRLAYVDHLTGMPNRRKFLEDTDAVSAALSSGESVGCVALFDLDNFKAVNDTYGHSTGDVMLRRLSESIASTPEFKDKLYRLGGDEFVLLLTNEATLFASDEAAVEYYSKQLSAVLQAYSIPNVELSCTLSMGLALAPQHGNNASELLRKADIALYESKSGGRNQLTVFRDAYDKARKFKDIYINIRPVLTTAGKTFGYELVEKSGEDNDDGTVFLTDFNRTLDMLNLTDMDNNLRYFIHYTEQLLSPSVTKNLPADKFIVRLEVSKNITQHNIGRIIALKKNKYMVALSGVHSATINPEVLRAISFCRFSKEDKNVNMQKRLMANAADVIFIADNINSQRDYEAAKQAGFRLFQGYYFTEAPPVSKKTKELDPISANYFRLLQLTSTDDYVDFKEISDIISGDVSMSYKLLKLLNSAAVGLRNVSSISMAVTYLGEDNLKKWVGLLALRGIGDDKPNELVRISLVRAQFGELLAPYLSKQKKHFFLLGTLSLLHVAMEMPKEELFEEIAVSEEIRDSLLSKEGPYSFMLKFFEDYEYANWDEVSRFAEEYKISCQTINECYIAAVKWYNDLVTPTDKQ